MYINRLILIVYKCRLFHLTRVFILNLASSTFPVALSKRIVSRSNVSLIKWLITQISIVDTVITSGVNEHVLERTRIAFLRLAIML